MSDDSQWPAFSSDAFLDVLRDLYFPGARKAIVECDGVRVRTLVAGQHRAVSGFWQMPFFLEGLPADPEAELVRVPYIEAVLRETTAADVSAPPGLSPSPFVRWRDFESWDAFLASRPVIDGVDRPSTLVRKSRRLERQVGPLDVRIEDGDPAVFETILRWKSLQYRRTGLFDKLADETLRQLYGEMNRRGMFIVSSLRAGNQLLAGNISHRFGARTLSRLPAYDIAFGRHSPGAILKMHILRASFEAGDEEFDFLLGGERYKYAYATHVRWIGPLGREATMARVDRAVRSLVGSALQNYRAQFDLRRLTRRLSWRK